MPKREARIIEMPAESEKTFRELYELFVISHAARGVSETTLKNYDYHMRNIAKYLDVEQTFEAITKRDIEAAITNMRRAGLAHNSIATYTRLLRAFYHWCGEEGYSSIDIPNIKEKETVKETYTDEELERLLKRPAKNCDFAEYRSWVIVNFLMNSGCRAATVRNIQNRDVDLEAKNVIFRHNKNGKIQTIPLCGLMVSILRDYMKVRKGKPEEYMLFVNVMPVKNTAYSAQPTRADILLPNLSESGPAAGKAISRPRPMAAMTATTEEISYIPSAPGTAPQSAANSCL